MSRHVIFVPFMTAFGGVERLVLGLSRFLNARGSPHSIVTFSNEINLESYADWSIDVCELHARRHPLLEGYSLRRWVQAGIRTQYLNTPILAFDQKGAFYAAFVSSAYAVHVTDPPSLLSADVSKYAPSIRGQWGRMLREPSQLPRGVRSELVHLINSRGILGASTVMTMTDRIAREIRELYGIEAQVIRPGIRLPSSLPRRAEVGPTIRFLSISRLVSSKRIDWILETLSTLDKTFWSKGISWELQVVGDGPARNDLTEKAIQLGVEANVRFSGRIEDSEIEHAYANATIFLMPASQGWGLPALEALSRDLPVVLHEDSGVSEILAESPWVELITDPDGRDFGDAIMRMLSRVQDGVLRSVPPPALPSEEEWAAQICAACSWEHGAVSGAVND